MNTYETVPKLETPDLNGESFLAYFKRAIGTGRNTNTGDTISVNWLQQDTHPQKVFYNRGEAPSQLFNTVLENLLNDIEDSTQMNYRGQQIPRQNLFQETNTENEEGSINMDYSTNGSRTSFPVRRLPLPGMLTGVPYRSTVFIDNTLFNEQTIKQSMAKEFLMQASVAKLGEEFPTEWNVYPRRIRAIMLSRMLSDYFNLSRIQN